jgi:hypothetical protein
MKMSYSYGITIVLKWKRPNSLFNFTIFLKSKFKISVVRHANTS